MKAKLTRHYAPRTNNFKIFLKRQKNRQHWV